MPGLRTLKSPLAVAMWDMSWLLRHQAGESFADWNLALDGLCERGYNAVRIECFPHLIAADGLGQVQQEFYFPKSDWSPCPWGNQWSTRVRPREGLVQFLEACRAREIVVGLSSWFVGDESCRNERVQGVDSFVRVWNETLSFLAERDLLEGIVYVDLLNEYPLWHSFTWLGKMLDTMSEPLRPGHKYNERQRDFYCGVLNEAIGRLKLAWPGLDFFMSLTHDDKVPWGEVDLSSMDALDKHIWFVYHPDFDSQTEYFARIHRLPDDRGFAACRRAIDELWNRDRDRLTDWMDNEVCSYARVASELAIPFGNTEGWGPVIWLEHPDLGWDFVKEAGLIGARLGAKHGCHFNCTSNFTHPHFPGIWNDVGWHREATHIIRSGNIAANIAVQKNTPANTGSQQRLDP